MIKDYIPDTTISIKPENLARLNNACERFLMKKNVLLSILLRTMLKTFTDQIKPVGHIRYQKSNKPTVIIHIGLSEQDYEQAQDLRRFTKFSVSYIIGYAIEHYLDEVIENWLLDPDLPSKINESYRKKYIVLIEKKQDSIKFEVQWGKSSHKLPLIE